MIVAKASGGDPPSHLTQTLFCPRERGVTQSGWWKDCLLKHPELRQVGKYFHDVQDLPVLELVVLKAAGRPMPSPLALRLRD